MYERYAAYMHIMFQIRVKTSILLYSKDTNYNPQRSQKVWKYNWEGLGWSNMRLECLQRIQSYHCWYNYTLCSVGEVNMQRINSPWLVMATTGHTIGANKLWFTLPLNPTHFWRISYTLYTSLYQFRAKCWESKQEIWCLLVEAPTLLETVGWYWIWWPCPAPWKALLYTACLISRLYIYTVYKLYNSCGYL